MTKPKKTLTGLQIKLGSIVDDPAQEHAKILMVKGADGVAKAYVPDDECTPIMTSETDGHQHTVYIAEGAVGGDTGYNSGDPNTGHTHPWVIDETGAITIGMSLGHTHEVTLPASAADPLIAAVTETLAEAAAEVAGAIADAAAGLTSAPEPMDDTMKSAAAQPAKGDKPQPAPYKDHKEIPNMSQPNTTQTTETEIAKLRAERDAAVALSKLSDAEKAHAATLHDDERPAFIAKSRAERAADMKAAADADPVVYECADGTVIRKSAGALAATQAKRIDELTKSNAISTAKTRELELMKRVGEVVPLVKGAPAVKAAMIDAIDGIPDAEVRKAAHEVLAGCNGAFEILSKSVGHRINNAESAGSAATDLRKYVGEKAAAAGIDYGVMLSKLSASDPTCRDLLERCEAERAGN